MIKPGKERLYSLRDFLTVLREYGLVRSYSSVHAWATKGVVPRGAGPAFDPIKLETRPIAGVLHTSPQAFERFIDAQNAAREEIAQRPMRAMSA